MFMVQFRPIGDYLNCLKDRGLLVFNIEYSLEALDIIYIGYIES